MKSRINGYLCRIADSGDDATVAFASLYEEMYRPVYLLAVSLTGNSGPAEDIAQDVFITAWRIAGRYRRGSSGRAWLFSITRNLCMHYKRSSGRITSIDDDPPATSNENFEDHSIGRIITAQALDVLSSHEREIVTLHVFGNFTLMEIADATETPYGTVLWRYYNARGKLKKYYSS